MFCPNCGTQNADGTAFCASCGTQLTETTVSNENNFTEVQPSTKPAMAQKAKANAFAAVETLTSTLKDKKKRTIFIGAAAVILVLIIGLIIGTSSSRSSTVKSYVKAVLNFNYSKAAKYCLLDQQDVIETYCKNNDEDEKEFFDNLTDMFNDRYDEDATIKKVSDFYSELGKHYEKEDGDEISSVKCEVLSEKEIDLDDSDERDDFESKIVYRCDLFDCIDSDSLSEYIDVDDISKAYKVKVKVEYKDEDGEKDSGKLDIYVAKYKGKWRVVGSPISAF